MMSTVLAAQLRAITHLAGMARGNLIALEPHLCSSQSLSMPGTFGLSFTLQNQLHHLSGTVSYTTVAYCTHAQSTVCKHTYTGMIQLGCCLVERE